VPNGISFAYFTRNKSNDIFVADLNTLNLFDIGLKENIFYSAQLCNFLVKIIFSRLGN